MLRIFSSLIVASVLAGLQISCIHSPENKSAEKVKNRNAVKRTVSAINGEGCCYYLANGMVPSQKTLFSVRYDQERLYLKGTCFFPKGEKIRICGKNKPDDMSLFSGECVEIFLCPRPGSGIYYQFAVSPNGTMYTAQGHDTSWEPAGVGKKITMKEDCWILEMSFPYGIFKVPAPKQGEVWGMNYCRTYAPAKGSSEGADWVGLVDFHCARDFGNLVFGPVKKLPRIILDGFKADPSGKVSARFSVDEISDPVSMIVRCGEKERESRYLPRKGVVSLSCEFPREYFPLKQDSEFTLLAKNARTGELYFSHHITLPGNAGNLLQLDKYYYVPADKKAAFAFHPDLKSVEGKTPVFTVSLISNGKVLKKQLCSEKGEFSLKGLKFGRYVIEIASGTVRTGRVFYYLPEYDRITGLPEGADFRISGNIFTAGGKPVFLLGGSTTGGPRPKEISFNMVAGNFGAAPNSVVITGMTGKSYHYKDFFCYLYPEKTKFFNIIRKFMKKFDPKAPGIFRMTYEAQIRTCFRTENGGKIEQNSVEWHKEYYKFLKKEYPSLYFSLQTDHRDYIPLFAPYCDVFEVTPRGGYSSNMMPRLIEGMPEAVGAAEKKPVITWIGATIPNNTCRFAEELRAAVYLNILHDGAGVIFHMGHGALSQTRTRMWSVIQHLNGEIQGFYPAFRSMPLLNAKDAAKVLNVKGGHYLCAIRGNGKEAIAVVLNLLPSENVLEFKASGAYTFRDRYGITSPKSFTWKSSPYEAAVFHLQCRR